MAVNYSVTPVSGVAMATEFTFTDSTVLPHATVYRRWDFGDTTFATGVSSVVHVFDFPGTYNVSLNIIDSTGTAYTQTYALPVSGYLQEAIKFVDPGLFVVEKGQTQRVPLRIELSAVDIADCDPRQGERNYVSSPCGHYVTLYSQFSKSTPLVPSLTANRWSSLEPYWRFLDLDMNPIDQIKTTDTVIYFEGSAVGVTGYAEFYYVDDSASPDPLILWATLQTSAMNFHMDTALGEYPSYANSKVNAAIPYYVDGVEPSYLGIGEDVQRDIFPIKWQNGTIPHLLTIKGRAVSKLDTEDAGESLIFNVGPSKSVFSTASGSQGFSVISQISGCEPDTYTFDTTTKKLKNGYLRGNATTTCTATGAAITADTVISYSGDPRITPYTWVGNPKNLSITQFHFPAKIPSGYPSTVIRPTSSIHTMSVPAVNTQFPGEPPFFSTLPSLYSMSTVATSAVSAGVFSGIYGYAVDPAYNVWVTDADLDRIYKFDSDRNTKEVIQLQTGTTPASICLDGDLNVYSGLHDGGAIVKLDKHGEFIKYITLPPYSSLSASPVFSTTRKLSAAYDVETVGPELAQPIAKPVVVETDSNNNLWVIYSSADYRAVVQFTPEGEYAQHIDFKQPFQPTDLIVDTFDNDALWVSTPWAWGWGGEIRKYTSTGRLLSSITNFYQPNTLAQDLSGNIWCTYGYDRIGMYNIKTHQTTTWIISATLEEPPPPPCSVIPPYLPPPTLNPGGGSYNQEYLRVVISTVTRCAYMSYTTDGSTPTRTHGTVIPGHAFVLLLHGPLNWTTVKAMAFWPGVEGLDSTVTSADYLLYNDVPVPEPTFFPVGGVYLNYFIFVLIDCSNEDAWLSYTTDGTDPSPTHGEIVTSNTVGIRLLARHNELTTITLKAMAFVDGDPTRNSPVHSEDYTLTAGDPDPPPGQLPPPTFHPGGGTYDVGRMMLEISDVISDAWLSYTLDGSTPTTTHGNIRRTSRFSFSHGIGEFTMKAVAFLQGQPDTISQVQEAHYIILGRPRGPSEEPGVELLRSYSDMLDGPILDRPPPDPGPTQNPYANLWFDPFENPDFSRIQGIACDSQNRIWAIDSEDNRVYIIGTPATIPVSGEPPPGPPRPPPGNLQPPSFRPPEGTYNQSTLSVLISSPVPDTYISYTTDGTFPTRTHGQIIRRRAGGPTLHGPIEVTINAIDFDPLDTHRNSGMVTATYTLEGDDSQDISGPGIDQPTTVKLALNFAGMDSSLNVTKDLDRQQPPNESGYAITSFKISPDTNIEVYDDTLDDTSYTATSAIFESAQSFGDWTGYKWHQKYAGYQIGRTRTRFISGASAWFNIYGFVDPFEIRKFNESFDVTSYLKSLPMPDILAQKHILFDKLFEYSIGGLETNDQSVARIAYERIANFVPNHSDIETCGIFQLYSMAEAMDVSLDDYNLGYPPELRRLLDVVSISHPKLWGARSKRAKKFKNDFSCCTDCKPVNRGAALSFTDFVTAGTPIVAKDFYSETYWLVPVFPLSGNDIDVNLNVYPLSEMDNPELKTPLSSWYEFFTYIPTYDNIQVEGVINWDDPYTTLKESNSSVIDWTGEVNVYGDNGILETIFNHQLHRGLGLIKD